jgi:hypothetical protein
VYWIVEVPAVIVLSLAAVGVAAAAAAATADVSAAVSSAVLLSSSVLYAAAAPSGRSVRHTAVAFNSSAVAIPGNPTPEYRVTHHCAKLQQ